MRKAFIILAGILFTLLFTTCKQFLADIDNELSYWASEATVRNVVLPEPLKDTDNVLCISSSQDQEFTFDVANRRNFMFKLPGRGAPQDILVFGNGITGSAGGVPVAGTDYEMRQQGAVFLN